MLELCRRQGSVRGLESRMRSGTGNTLQTLVSAERIQWEKSPAVLLAAQDVTERFELVNQLRESQRMEAVGQLAAGVAHDFNNILTIIQGNSDMIRDEAEKGSEIEELNRELNNAAQRASGLAGQLLAFSRKQLMRPQILDLNDVVADSTRLLRRVLGAPVRITTRLNDRPPHVYADPGLLEQVLMNLAVNARDAMPNGGTLTMQTRIVHFTPGSGRRHAGRAEGTFVLLRVTDTGTGMPPEILERIFEPFFTTKDVGKFVFHHGWHIYEMAKAGTLLMTSVEPYGIPMLARSALESTFNMIAALNQRDFAPQKLAAEAVETAKKLEMWIEDGSWSKTRKPTPVDCRESAKRILEKYEVEPKAWKQIEQIAMAAGLHEFYADDYRSLSLHTHANQTGIVNAATGFLTRKGALALSNSVFVACHGLAGSFRLGNKYDSVLEETHARMEAMMMKPDNLPSKPLWEAGGSST